MDFSSLYPFFYILFSFKSEDSFLFGNFKTETF